MRFTISCFVFQMTTLANHNSTYANRLLHRQTNQIIIGAWIIDLEGKVRVFPDLLQVRVAATAEHLTHPESMVSEIWSFFLS